MATATAMVLTVAQTLFATLQCKELRDLCSMFGYQSDLDDLQRTASTIKAVLLDADSKLHVLPHEARDWIEKLKDAVYDVDDLLDGFNTIVQRSKLQEQTDGGKVIKKIAKKVRRFFSRSNHLVTAFKTSLDVKEIKNKLDAIASDHNKFRFSINYEPIKRARQETWSYVDKARIIGRDDDKEAVVGLLLQDHNTCTVDRNVNFVTIVGMGGLGKTALAQIVYDDDRIKKEFNLRLWVCVSDEFGMREILTKMLKSVSDENMSHLGNDQLIMKVKEKMEGKKYLLVLDDVWCESHKDWVKLKDFLMSGASGSRILLTTRSKLVAKAIGGHPVHVLEGLSQEDSWRLFAHMAFDSGEQADAKLVEIGKEIVKKCTNVPLSIIVTSSMLYGQGLQKWKLFVENELSEIIRGEDDTMAILKFSYDHFTPALKSCFTYCALFPKDHEIEKNLLINLWLAHGCLEPQFRSQRLEDIGEEYFSILLNRCFFQEIETDIFGDVERCKMHDLIHDLAQNVAGNDLLSWSGSVSSQKFRHLSIVTHDPGSYNSILQVKSNRTFLVVPRGLKQLEVAPIVSSYRHLRVLDLHSSSVKVLPKSIGDLVHLRYLDLNGNRSLQILPESITKLHNLQVMILRGCQKLKALPNDLSKLVNLSMLDITNCELLSYMPAGMEKLSCLERLTGFIVGKTNSKQRKVSPLDDLKALTQLGGDISIELGEYWREVQSEFIQSRCYPLVNSHLKSLKIRFPCYRRNDEDKLVLKGLQPNSDLRMIDIFGYGGIYLPSWANSLKNSLPSLVVIRLCDCCELRCLPSMRQLGSLKFLKLETMPNLEYIEESSATSVAVSDVPLRREDKNRDELTFFPCLEKLELIDMGKLKGWWRPDMNIGDEEATSSFSKFPCLRDLDIRCCPNLISFPSFSNLQTIHQFESSYLSSRYSRREHKMLVTDKIGGYKYCKDKWFTNGLVELVFTRSEEGSMCSRIETINFFKICGSSLRHLEISYCSELKRVGKGVFEHLSNLHSLRISSCRNLAFEDEEEVMMSWKSLETLSRLDLLDLDKMVKLPKGIQYLTSLQSLRIISCDNLSSLSEWISCLSSLQYLEIYFCRCLKSLPEAIRYLPSLTHLHVCYCDGLTTRCRGPNGEYWPIIQHIPDLRFSGERVRKTVNFCIQCFRS